MSKPPLSPDPDDEPDAPGEQDGALEFHGALRPAVPGLPKMPPFPAVLPEDPDERAEVLRQFAEWDSQRKEAQARLLEEFAARQAEADYGPYDLTERMRKLGAPDPESWARSEQTEDIPQEARWLIVREVWPSVDSFSVEQLSATPAAARLLDAGADPADLATAMRHAAMSGAFGALVTIDGMSAMNAPLNSPGWALMETRYDPEVGDHVSTGRLVGGLHESLSSADPSGRGGSDLFE